MLRGLYKDESLYRLEGPLRLPRTGSHVSEECHRLWVTPIREYRCEDVRLMINQGLGVPHLLPVAVELLHGQPFRMCSLFPGDLLVAVSRVVHSRLEEHLICRHQVRSIMTNALVELQSRDPDAADVPDEVRTELQMLSDAFR